MAQRDVVLRWIEELGRLIGRLLRRGTAGDLDLAREEIERATADLLGSLAPLVPQLDTASAAALLADPDRLFAWAQLVELGGLVAEAQGNAAAGASARRRALELGREACRRSRVDRPDWAEWVAARSDAT
jgi:hypothetical protein